MYFVGLGECLVPQENINGRRMGSGTVVFRISPLSLFFHFFSLCPNIMWLSHVLTPLSPTLLNIHTLPHQNPHTHSPHNPTYISVLASTYTTINPHFKAYIYIHSKHISVDWDQKTREWHIFLQHSSYANMPTEHPFIWKNYTQTSLLFLLR